MNKPNLEDFGLTELKVKTIECIYFDKMKKKYEQRNEQFVNDFKYNIVLILLYITLFISLCILISRIPEQDWARTIVFFICLCFGGPFAWLLYSESEFSLVKNYIERQPYYEDRYVYVPVTDEDMMNYAKYKLLLYEYENKDIKVTWLIMQSYDGYVEIKMNKLNKTYRFDIDVTYIKFFKKIAVQILRELPRVYIYFKDGEAYLRNPEALLEGYKMIYEYSLSEEYKRHEKFWYYMDQKYKS